MVVLGGVAFSYERGTPVEEMRASVQPVHVQGMLDVEDTHRP